MYSGQEELDNLVWDKNDEDSDKSQKQMRLKTICRQVERLAKQKFRKPATLVSPLIIGGFNILYRLHLEGVTPDIIVRLPCPSLVQFPDEKTDHEAATAAYISNNTEVPTPQVFFSGRDSTLGPFVIMQYIENHGSMSARLKTPNDDLSVTHVLNPSIAENTLESLWGQTARCYLQLSRLSFPRIGSLVEVDGSYNVAGRPITHNMTDMVRLANIPRAVLPQEGKTYRTADEWYIALAEMNIAQLIFQHNDSVVSEDDCRNKYVARQIFYRLAKQGRVSTFGFAEDDWSAQSSKKIMPSNLSPAPAGSNSFRLWGDELRAGNILIDGSDNIAAIIDWEFAYAAPTQFILDPPWWLLLNLAETWSSGIDNWRERYEPRLKTWLSAMERAEESMEEPGPLPVALSTYMRESWETSRFWLNYGARKSWAFDTVYWRFLDERFFGDRGSNIAEDDLWKTRIHLLSKAER
ncbi:Phosphotransferase [Venustampulla echinocandica]|uniref:Phosphotransferase n=1 Tax=Venustampulla echinocandica TaxID=2656787 RepID=A0A370TYI8_9HELO|nr:Phosphotransferase [Venustampulla echinocandica]RDL40596.1 Phosphotransferase [Venustampulla echinocandica]